MRRQRRYRAVGRAGFAAGARGYCDKYGKPKDVHRPSHVIALANWFVSAVLDCRLALVRGQLLLKALSGLIEAGIPSSFLVQPDKLGPTTVSRTKIVSLGIERSLEPI